MTANLLHMEEMAFPCKICFFLMRLSCADDDESQHVPSLSSLSPFVSGSSLLSLQGREANRHQGRRHAVSLSAPLLFVPSPHTLPLTLFTSPLLLSSLHLSYSMHPNPVWHLGIVPSLPLAPGAPQFPFT